MEAISELSYLLYTSSCILKQTAALLSFHLGYETCVLVRTPPSGSQIAFDGPHISFFMYGPEKHNPWPALR